MFQCDIIYLLEERFMDDVVDNILLRLDPQSLRNCELVSKMWRRSVQSGHIWKKLLDSKTKNNSMWRKLLNRLPKSTQNDHLFQHKQIVSAIATSIEKLDRNWRTGCSTRIPMNADVETDPFFKISADRLISRAYGPLGLLSDLLIFDMRMSTIEKEIHMNGNINCYDFNEEFVACGLDDGTILIVDLATEEVLNILVDPRGRVASLCLSPGLLISVSGDNDPPSDINVEKDWLLTIWRVNDAADITKQQEIPFTGEWLYVTADGRFVAALEVKNQGTDSLAHFISTECGQIVRSLVFDYTNDIWQYGGGLFVTCRREPPCNVKRKTERTLRITDVTVGKTETKQLETCCDNTYHIGFNDQFLVCSGRSGLLKHLEIYSLPNILEQDTSIAPLSTISWPEEKRYGFFRMNEFYIVGLGGSGWNLDMNFHVLDFTK